MMKTSTLFVLLALPSVVRPALAQTDVEPAAGGDAIDLALPNEGGARASVEGTLMANKDAARRLLRSWSDSAGIDEAEYAAGISEHVKLLGKFEQKHIDTLVQIGEYAYRRLNWIAYGKTDVPWLKRAGGKAHFYMTDAESFTDLVSWLTENRTIDRKSARSIVEMSKDLGGSSQPGPIPLSVRKVLHHPASGVANNMGVNWLFYNATNAMREIHLKTKEPQGLGAGGRGRGHRMRWLSEGLGMWASIDAIGDNNFWRVTKQVYKNVGRAKKGGDSDRIAMCYELATDQIKKNAKNLYQLTRTRLNTLTDLDLAMSWSIVDYLIRERTKDWRRLIQRCQKQPSFRIAFVETFGTDGEASELKRVLDAKDDRGLEKLYQTAIGRFELSWKAWAKARYQAEYNDPSEKKTVDAPFREIQTGAAAQDDEGDGKGKDKKKRRKRRR